MTRSIHLDPPPDPGQGKLSSLAPRLLVSIRNVQEARLARLAGVDWIDLKNPDGGSLGPADEGTAAAVAEELSYLAESAGSANCVVSAAAGELRDAPQVLACGLAQYFPLLKVGLAGMRGQASWNRQIVELDRDLQTRGASLVPVIYADYEHCLAPNPAQVIQAASEMSSGIAAGPCTTSESLEMPRYLLVDTYTKDGRRLMDWIDRRELQTMIAQASQIGRRVVLAGSLALDDLPFLMSLPVAAIAVRGAVCRGDRQSQVCLQKLQQWVELFGAR